MITREISKSDAFTKMTLPRTSIRHVIPARTRKTHIGRGAHRGPRYPPSISRAHVDYNYPQVITTHTIVFQWALTAVRPLYSAKLVFPFPVEESRTEIARGKAREREREIEKRRNFRRPLVGPRFNASRPHPLLLT